MISLAHCGTTIYAPKESSLDRPLGLEVTPIANQKFQISYFVTNQEEIFLGYNLYVSKISITDSDFGENPLVNHLLPEGEQPTFPYSKLDFDSETAQNETIEFFDGVRLQFECDQEYFFRLRAFGEGGRHSQPSNEDSGIAFKTAGVDCEVSP